MHRRGFPRLIFIQNLWVRVGVCVGIFVCECRGQRSWVPPTAGVTSGFKLLGVGAGDQTWVLCESHSCT